MIRRILNQRGSNCGFESWSHGHIFAAFRELVDTILERFPLHPRLAFVHVRWFLSCKFHSCGVLISFTIPLSHIIRKQLEIAEYLINSMNLTMTNCSTLCSHIFALFAITVSIQDWRLHNHTEVAVATLDGSCRLLLLGESYSGAARIQDLSQRVQTEINPFFRSLDTNFSFFPMLLRKEIQIC